MAFPVSPTNGSTTTVNGIVYSYSTTDNAWTRLSTSPGNLTVTGNLTSSGNLITANIYFGNIAWANGVPISLTGTYSNTNVAAYLTEGTVSITNLAVGDSLIQQDVLDLNNNNLYNVNTIRINDPGTSEGIAWEGGSGWNIYESPNDLSNNTGNLQVVLSGTRVFTVDTNQTVNIPSTWEATSATTGALTVGGGVGIGGNLWVSGNIHAGNLITIGVSTLSVTDPLLYLTATNPSPYDYDIGFFSHFVGGSLSNYQHTGFSRNYTDNTWTLFSNVFAEPGVTISWTDANIIYDPIKVGSANIANTTISTSSTTGALVVGGGAGIAGNAYIGGNVVVTSNVSANKFYTTDGLYWSGNGTPFTSGTVDYTASATAPINPDDGDFWYQTTTGILFQYMSDGVTSYWFDVQTQSISGVSYSDANVASYVNTTINILSPFLLAGM